jgi:hypothetical protein
MFHSIRPPTSDENGTFDDVIKSDTTMNATVDGSNIFPIE